MEGAINSQTLKDLEQLKALVTKKGIVKDQIIEALNKLRPQFIEQEQPLVTRVIRQTIEFLEENDLYTLNLLAEEDEDGNIDEDIDPEGTDSFNEMKENFLYLIELFANPQNRYNHEELTRIKELYLERDIF